MHGVMRGLGQILAAMAIVAVIGGAAISAPQASAKPVKDTRTVETKVDSFHNACASAGGKASSRPSATDPDKTICRCDGGLLGGDGGYACVYTPTTRECGDLRDDPSQPGEVPQVDDDLGLAKVTNAQDDASPDASDDYPEKGKKSKHDKHGKGGKNGKRARR